MNRVWTALLLLATVVVAGAVGFVLVHNDPVPRAGQTPGYSASPLSPSSTDSKSPQASASGSGGASTTATTKKARSALRIAFLGDNWTNGAGVGHKAEKSFPALVAKGLHVKDTVAASDGAGYAKHGPDGKAYGDLVSKIVAAKPDIVVVTGGRNDVSDDQATLTSDAKDLFAALKSQLPAAKLVAVAPFWGDSDQPSDLAKVDAAVKAGVQAAGGTYLDLADPLHNHSDWMADSANPDEHGEKAIAEALRSQLEKML